MELIYEFDELIRGHDKCLWQLVANKKCCKEDIIQWSSELEMSATFCSDNDSLISKELRAI